MIVGGIIVALVFTGASVGMGAAIEAQNADLREHMQQGW